LNSQCQHPFIATMSSMTQQFTILTWHCQLATVINYGIPNRIHKL
jgi:hypothetical protein